MSIDKYSTLTSGILASKMENFEVEHFNPGNINSNRLDKILVLENSTGVVSDYDFAVQSMYEAGFRIIISSRFPDVFCVKAMSIGIFPIEISEEFVNKILNEFKLKSKIKLFVDMVGQEVMIVKTGEKEFFELTDYKKECLLNGCNEVDYLYCIWDEINCSEREINKQETIEYAIE
ncbi:MAG: hypothetical protein A2X13_00185 [Bacteroidetes bacterium GWC2_33_15]|nr:MAG: hypothetical protein A2X10_03995 [Bacteroidetes bacterium GWA2_33_15]OFX51044.1 MAG: hypothetical protein A2X13_00185 [Bacteroidetes bacterium GWC2_33_15]OFX65667.1 MAG: hypothetical protein A2X15_13805 [Bacteroidetes bacterium GWB2_32_14]OFX70252.1 MAG: hypothetical protein A2X14_03075 [Bacteroidetes bacterium GWD2_33_33]HAN17248.1 hypothetical protein [Bacteroidales bacterium]